MFSSSVSGGTPDLARCVRQQNTVQHVQSVPQRPIEMTKSQSSFSHSVTESGWSAALNFLLLLLPYSVQLTNFEDSDTFSCILYVISALNFFFFHLRIVSNSPILKTPTLSRAYYMLFRRWTSSPLLLLLTYSVQLINFEDGRWFMHSIYKLFQRCHYPANSNIDHRIIIDGMYVITSLCVYTRRTSVYRLTRRTFVQSAQKLTVQKSRGGHKAWHFNGHSSMWYVMTTFHHPTMWWPRSITHPCDDHASSVWLCATHSDELCWQQLSHSLRRSSETSDEADSRCLTHWHGLVRPVMKLTAGVSLTDTV